MRERFEILKKAYKNNNEQERDDLISLLLYFHDSTVDSQRLVSISSYISNEKQRLLETSVYCLLHLLTFASKLLFLLDLAVSNMRQRKERSYESSDDTTDLEISEID